MPFADLQPVGTIPSGEQKETLEAPSFPSDEPGSRSSSMHEDSPFRQFVRRLRAGDNEAVEELVQRYGPTIRRVARVRLGDTRLQRLFDSADICQSVFGSFVVRVALGQYDLETPEQLLNLLLAMGRKKVADRAREAGADRRDYRRTQETAEVSRVVAPLPDPGQQVAARELLEEFRKRLTDEERSLADQRAAGRSWAQIAEESGGSSEALRKQLSRAVDRVALEMGLETFP
jgi:RNA polymerase sigma-70 factor (ECF subfamily)